MSLFEVGKSYSISYGPVESPSHTTIKVLEIDSGWMRVQSDYVEPLINLASAFVHTAREFDESALTGKYAPRQPKGI